MCCVRMRLCVCVRVSRWVSSGGLTLSVCLCVCVCVAAARLSAPRVVGGNQYLTEDYRCVRVCVGETLTLFISSLFNVVTKERSSLSSAGTHIGFLRVLHITQVVHDESETVKVFTSTLLCSHVLTSA